MNYRKLRIAWSVAWGVLSLLLIALWVRSYEFYENVTVLAVQASSGRGQIAASLDTFYPVELFSYKRQPADDGGVYVYKSIYEMMLFRRWHGFQISAYRPTAILVPHWFGISLATVAAAVPWLHIKRFSLRTLLIATTVVAVGLGLVIWAAK